MVDRLGLVGRTIDGRYRIDAMIGEGAMGAVYRAEHNRLGRTVAIKFLHREYAKDPEALQRFFTEARAVASLGHANIVDSLDMGELPDGEPYLVLEFLDGRQLSEAIQHAGRLSTRRSLRIARQIAAGLEVVHEHDIIHRDLKSENVFLTVKDDSTDHVKILDFGVARILSSRTSATKPGHLVGTPEFMPPEQISDPDHIDARADVYAAGAILYHMLSGQKPYAGTTQIATLLHKILREPPAPLPDDVPPEVQQLVRDAMARDRDQRIPTMRELGNRIERIAVSGAATPFPLATPMPVVAAPPAGPSTTPTNMTAPTTAPVRRRLPIVLGSAVVVIGIGIALFMVLKKGDSSTSAKATNGSGDIVATMPTTGPTPAPTPTPAPAPTPTPAVADDTPVPSTKPGTAATTGPAHPAGVHEATVVKPRTVETKANPTTAVATKPKLTTETTHKGDAEKAAQLAAELEKARAEADKARLDAEAQAAAEKAKADAAAKAAANAKTPAAPTKTGVDVAAVRAAVKPKLGAIMNCIERARMDEPSLAGTVTVRITETADGAVSNAVVASTTLGSPSAERCVVAEIGHWHLPKPLGGVAATFDYPFVFR